mmetsp:Transcript_34885/g.62348  ORF Transcript_34885/g.62348 Transcript_34885/m.62348 type:complete len:262 (-) Transcript_34885:1229-2014(-)
MSIYIFLVPAWLWPGQGSMGECVHRHRPSWTDACESGLVVLRSLLRCHLRNHRVRGHGGAHQVLLLRRPDPGHHWVRLPHGLPLGVVPSGLHVHGQPGRPNTPLGLCRLWRGAHGRGHCCTSWSDEGGPPPRDLHGAGCTALHPAGGTGGGAHGSDAAVVDGCGYHDPVDWLVRLQLREHNCNRGTGGRGGPRRHQHDDLGRFRGRLRHGGHLDCPPQIPAAQSAHGNSGGAGVCHRRGALLRGLLGLHHWGHWLRLPVHR